MHALAARKTKHLYKTPFVVYYDFRHLLQYLKKDVAHNKLQCKYEVKCI